MTRYVACIGALLFVTSLAAQDKTIGNRPSKVDETAKPAKYKVMIVPFEPKLYFGEIDRQIHEETQLSAASIRHRFRDGVNEQLYRSFRASGFQTLDLMDDTAKYARDLSSIYQYLAFDYVKVPDQNNYKPPTRDKEQKKVEKGQIIVETNSDARFMNAHLTNPKIVPQLSAKYKTELFVLINQLDLKASGSHEPSQLTANPNRKITVHYTVLTGNGKEINSGIAEQEFSPELNNPKKIVDKHFSAIASTIVKRVEKALLVK
jgi:hypothetical protein